MAQEPNTLGCTATTKSTHPGAMQKGNVITYWVLLGGPVLLFVLLVCKWSFQ